MTIVQSNKIGIWGFGITGKSAVNYLLSQGNSLAVMDKKELSETDRNFLLEHNIPFYTEEQREIFFSSCDFIIPSPGVDLRAYTQHHHKWISELDIFYAAWNKPLIAITGSIGKTTVTHLLSKVLAHTGLRVATGGNIGTPMLDFIANKNQYDIALLEVSSFQLELCKTFAPDLAIWTNFYPNHLDRHSSEDDYFQAKATMLSYQTPAQQALVPLSLAHAIKSTGTVSYFSLEKPTHYENLHEYSKVFFKDKNDFIAYGNDTETILTLCDQIPLLSFEENWLIICSALELLNIPLPNFLEIDSLSLPEHRLEKVATLNGVTFYNDSKSTTVQSTLAAINRLQGQPILLLLGGLSKGVDRTPFIEQISGKVKKIYCFGKEAEQLKTMCDMYNVPSILCTTLDDAVHASYKDATPGDQIVLSPAGSSYDLFTNYIERGNHFKQLVKTLS